MNTLADIARWQRVKHILGQALDLPTGQRLAFLRSQAADDDELNQLQALQAAGAADHALLDGGREQLFAQPGVRVPQHLLAADTPLAEPDGFSANWTGRRVGPYHLLGLIARGGMGQVYRAERVVPSEGDAPTTAVGQPVAVKLVREGWVGSALQRRFHAERRILERLDHPNLARLLDGGIHADMPYLVMELVDGEPIDQHCRRHALDVPDVLRLFLMLCDVVHYAHGQGVVHRDLKPANVLVTREGQVKLLDFGIAKQLAGFTPAGESTATVTALRVMTLACASPEQVRGLAVTPASDVYSLGVLLFRLLTGALPYRFGAEDTAGNDLDLRNAICKAPPTRPSQVPQTPPARQRALRGNLDAVLLKALRKDPARRYPSAAALADELRRHLDQRRVEARWPGSGGLWGLSGPRGVDGLSGLGPLMQQPHAQRGTLLAAGLLLATGAAVGLLAWQQVRVQAARTEADWARIQSHLQTADALQRQATTLAALGPARQLLQQALQSLDRLHAPAPADPTQRFAALDLLRRQAVQDAALSARLAQAYGRIGIVQAGSDGLGVDDPAAAERSLRRALALFGPAVVGSTDAAHMAALRHDWAAAQAALSGLLQLEGRSDEALGLAREALANARQAAGPDTERVLAQAELALARALDPVAAGAEAQGLLRAALYRLETLRRRQPADPTLELAVAAVHRQQGLTLLRADDSLPPSASPAAHAFLLAVLMLSPQAAGPAPAPSAQLALALAQHGLAQALHQGQPLSSSPSQGGEDGGASALASATQARDAVHALWRTAPQQRALHWHLADLSATLGRLQLAAGAADAAVQTARTAVDAAPAPDTLAPDDHASRGRLGWAWYGLGQALVARASATGMATAAVHEQPPSDWLRACDSYRRALALLEPLRAAPPGQAPVPDAARLIEMRQVLRTSPAP